jgi:hypothetical protein
MKDRVADAFEKGSYAFTDRRRNRRNIRKTLCQSCEVEAGAADENWDLSTFMNLPKRPRSVHLISTNRVVLPRAHVTKKVVRHTPHVVVGRSGGHNADLAIYLHRVGIDDLGTYRFRDAQGGGRLAACGRACDKHGVELHPAPGSCETDE